MHDYIRQHVLVAANLLMKLILPIISIFFLKQANKQKKRQ